MVNQPKCIYANSPKLVCPRIRADSVLLPAEINDSQKIFRPIDPAFSNVTRMGKEKIYI